MTVSINDEYVLPFLTEKEILSKQAEVNACDKTIRNKTGAGSDFLGWLTLPSGYDKKEFETIKKTARKIQEKFDAMVVIGIGGSYLGSRAVIEFIKGTSYNVLPKKTPDIYFAGNSLSTSSLADTLELVKDKNFCVNVISKSGTTTEPAVAFRIFRDLLEKKYGADGARERIFVTTDKEKGTLKSFSTEKGYQTFVIPDDVGGRFSVLTAVGLLPIAVSGVDVDKLMEGAQKAQKEFTNTDIEKNPAYKYAVIRNLLYGSGKKTEVMASFEPFTATFHEWFKQLYGESEGKDNKGIFPTSVVYSTDLHSLGQIVQDGERTLFETFLNVKESDGEIIIPDDANNVDGLNFLTGEKLSTVNARAMKGTILAHVDGKVPCIVVDVEKRDEESLGYLIYFFELAVAMSGYLLGVNPFNQPGVEEYKKNMFALLGKPGYEEKRKELLKRLK